MKTNWERKAMQRIDNENGISKQTTKIHIAFRPDSCCEWIKNELSNNEKNVLYTATIPTIHN